MKCIYVRHAKTEFSLNNKFAGRLDIPIVGINDKLLFESFAIIDELKPSILLHSPMLRAIQTTEYFKRRFDFSEVISEPLLIERDFGILEGEIKSSENRSRLDREASVESLFDFDCRVKSFLSKYRDIQSTVLVVGHSAFYRQLAKLYSINNKVSLDCCEANYFNIQK